MATRFKHGSGNVFRDLGFDAVESENLRVRSELMIAIEKIIRSRELTQSAAAKLFGVTQPRVSDLVRGKIERFSVDGLLEMLSRAGVRVQLVFKKTRRAA